MKINGVRVKVLTVQCTSCDFTGSPEAVEVHSCYVQRQGGRCEDYPCCGHGVDGDGCQTRPEHTSAHWSRLQEKMGDEAYEDMLMRMEERY